MKTEIQCICGYGTTVDPAAVKSSAKCERCGKTLTFATTGDDRANCYWVMMGQRGATPTRAVPMLDDRPVAIGSCEACWLVISGDGVQSMNTELRVDVDRRVHVRHIAESGRTWIDRAAVHEGVLEFDNELRIGEHVFRLCTTATLQRVAAADSAPVLIESDDDSSGASGDDYYEEEDRAPRRQRRGFFEDWSAGHKLKALGLLAVISIALAISVKMVMYPAKSEEMPAETVYTCPVDGETFRGNWADGIPKCPKCGQLILGAIDYDAPPKEKPRPPQADAIVNDDASGAAANSGSTDKETP